MKLHLALRPGFFLAFSFLYLLTAADFFNHGHYVATALGVLAIVICLLLASD